MSLIPSIDLLGGRVVQLEQGERLRWSSDDLDGWMARFARFPIVQVIDLDAARGSGSNDALVRRVAGALPCQVGGGIHTVTRAEALIAAGARRVIVGSSLFRGDQVDTAHAVVLAEAIGRSQVIAAVDSRHGRVVVSGWRRELALTPAEAMRALEPHVGAFLYTHVDTEGLLGGFDFDVIGLLKGATSRPIIVAGGIRSREEVDRLHSLGVDAVVGMAIYTGVMEI